jgi:ferredoxin
VGFVFPHYALGVPRLVRERLARLDCADNRQCYFFAVESCGAFPGNCLGQVNALLKKKSLRLSYGAVVKMFANNVVNYDMRGNPAESAAQADGAIASAASAILQKQTIKIPRDKPLYQLLYRTITATYPRKGRRFHADDTCVGCGQCAKLCPAGNITLQNAQPVFGAKCEQCVACIQYCPRQAIQFANKTQSRGRYHHPGVTLADMLEAYQNT